MKRTTIHISAAIALLLGLAACTQDEAGFLPEGAEGTPIVFTATGLNPAATATAGTRAPADGNWTGVQSVAVMMDGMVKTYNVTPSTADPTSATLTSTDPYYWTNHNDITVTAWWPYTAGETTPPAVKVKANQSAQKDFEGSDLIVADGQTVTYGSSTLRFTHRTARVTIVLTDYTEGLASVQLTGLSTEGDNPDIIVPYDKGSNTYTALVAPQSVAAGTTFITCTFTNGKTFVYKMKNATDWQAGGEYTYTVSLAAAKDLGYTIESNGSYTVTSADGLMNIAKLVNGGKTDINITLDTDIDLTGKDWTPIGTDYDNSYKGTFDGGGHTITGLTFTTNDEYAGLFGWLNRAGTVKNVVMEGVQITSHQIYGGSIGGVVGSGWGTIENCSVSGSVSGTVYVGGVVGVQIGGSITGCSSSATVKGTRYVGGVAEKYGVPYRTEMKDYLYACYGEHVKEEANIPDGVLDVLHTLRARGYRLAVCSSADRIKVLMNLSAIGAEESLFDQLVTGTDIKNPKPDPEIYLTGAASLGLAPSECIVVEDAPSGIRAAHAAGIEAIGLATSFPADYLREQAQPDYLLPDLKSILMLL